MNGNPGTCARFARENFSRKNDEQALTGFRDAARNAEAVGGPGRNAELYELERLVRKYPIETRKILRTLGEQEE